MVAQYCFIVCCLAQWDHTHAMQRGGAPGTFTQSALDVVAALRSALDEPVEPTIAAIIIDDDDSEVATDEVANEAANDITNTFDIQEEPIINLIDPSDWWPHHCWCDTNTGVWWLFCPSRMIYQRPSELPYQQPGWPGPGDGPAMATYL